MLTPSSMVSLTAQDAAASSPTTPSTDPPPSGIADALLHSVVWLTRHHGRERSAQSLLADLPLSGAMGPGQAIRVMREAGFNAGLIQRRIGEIHSLLLPAVLPLKNGGACILVRRLEAVQGSAPDRYEVVDPLSIPPCRHPGVHCHPGERRDPLPALVRSRSGGSRRSPG